METVRTVKSERMEMRYCRFGNPEGQPFVILPGAAVKSVMESAMLIEKQYAAFAADYDVYVMDRRTDLPEPYSIAEMAEDTAEALRLLGLQNVNLYGVSQGGMIAQMMAVQHPELVKKLALCATAPYMPDDGFLRRWTELAEQRDADALMLAFGEKVYTQQYLETYRNAFQVFARTVTEEDLRRFVICVSGIAGFDVRPRLHEIRCPVLVIGAEEDQIFGSAPAKEIAEKTGGKLVIYSEQPHAVYDMEPDVLVQIKAFLDAHDMTFEEAVSAIPKGRYRHFKGNEYEVLEIARHSETLEPMVVYRALYGEGGVWVRPAKMWNEPAGDGTVRRFTKI